MTLGVVVHTCNHSTRDAEAVGSEVSEAELHEAMSEQEQQTKIKIISMCTS